MKSSVGHGQLRQMTVKDLSECSISIMGHTTFFQPTARADSSPAIVYDCFCTGIKETLLRTGYKPDESAEIALQLIYEQVVHSKLPPLRGNPIWTNLSRN